MSLIGGLLKTGLLFLSITGTALLVVTTLLGIALALWGPKQPALISAQNETTLTTDSASIRYNQSGPISATPIVFLHGFNSQLSIWDGIRQRLNNCAPSIALDIPGYGGSKTESQSFTLNDQATRIIEFLDRLQIHKVTLVGVSMGGSLAAWIAAKYPDRIQTLVLLAPSGFPGSLQYGERTAALYHPGPLNQLAQRIAGTELYRFLFPRSTTLQALSVTASYGAPWARALNEVQATTWILWSKGDTAVPFLFSEKVANSISNSTLIPLAEAVGHDIPGNRSDLVANLLCTLRRGKSKIQVLDELKIQLQEHHDG